MNTTIARHTKVRLKKLAEFEASDYGMDDEQYQKLLEHEGDIATVDCEATPGYFDVTCSDGFEIGALSTYHMHPVKVAK